MSAFATISSLKHLYQLNRHVTSVAFHFGVSAIRVYIVKVRLELNRTEESVERHLIIQFIYLQRLNVN